MQTAKAKYVPRIAIRVYRAKSGRWEDHGVVGETWLQRLKRMLWKGK